LISANPKVQLKVDFDSKKLPQKFLGDSLRIRQVLINLLSNAIKFTEQGTITVKVSLRRTLSNLPWTSTLSPRPQILRVPSSVFSKKGLLVSSSESDIKITEQPSDKAYLIFSVKDTGIGVDKKHILKVFDAFEQGDSNTSAKYGGSGLGLAISKRICLLHGGDISVVSRGKDQGSAFYFYIPYCEVTNSDQDNTKRVEYFDGDSSQELQTDLTSDYRLAPIPRVSTQGQTALIDSYKNAATSLRDSFEKPEKLSLLLAEDNKVNQLVIKSMLKKLNCSVDIANNGREAVEKTKQKHYDLIFMDIEMPEMNGLEAASILQQQLNSTPIVALTAHALAETREEALRSGMKDVITKPCTFEQLQLVCDKYVNKQSNGYE
jgi:CheY-like chemotaxis protein